MTEISAASLDLEPDELLALARLDIDKGELESALRKLKSVLAHANPPAGALSMTARLYAQLGLLPRAKQLFQAYLKHQPDALNERFQLGMVHFDSGEADDASKIWEQVLVAAPTHPPALHYLGLLCAQQNRVADARRHLEVLLKATPPDNLYFERSKELLKAIDNNLNTNLATNANVSPAAARSPYQNEH
jgi:tetratricopeptide (TPR) repeat protein